MPSLAAATTHQLWHYYKWKTLLSHRYLTGQTPSPAHRSITLSPALVQAGSFSPHLDYCHNLLTGPTLLASRYCQLSSCHFPFKVLLWHPTALRITSNNPSPDIRFLWLVLSQPDLPGLTSVHSTHWALAVVPGCLTLPLSLQGFPHLLM